MLWGIHLFHFFFGLFLVLLMCVCSVMFNSFVTPWTARLLSPWNFPGKNIGVGCHFLDPGIKPKSPALAGRFFTTEPPGKPWLV